MKLTPWMLTVAAFGIISLLAVGFLFKKLLATPVVEVKAPEGRVLPMAISEIAPGTLITRNHLGNGRAKPGETLAEDTFLNIDGIVGRIAKERIPSAVPLRGEMFYAIGDHPGLTVSEGKQAVVVRVSETTGVLNQKVKSGQHVDVLLTVDGTGTSVSGGSQLQSVGNTRADDDRLYYDSLGSAVTVTLFRGVKVLSVSQGYTTTALQNGNAQNVTLELDPDEARIISLAQRKGEIDLVYSEGGISGPGITIEQKEKDRITLQEILGVKPGKGPEKPFRTEHYRGGGRNSIYFDEDGDRVGSDGSDGGWGGGLGTPLQSSSAGWSADAGTSGRKDRNADKSATRELVQAADETAL